MSGFDIVDFLTKANAAKASDVHLMQGEAPILRKNGKIMKVDMPPLTDDDMDKTLCKVLPDFYRSDVKDLDMFYEIPNVSRFRVNLSKSFGKLKFSFRVIPCDIMDLKTLGLPELVEDFTKFNNGLVLVTGPTGSGKTTTLASLVDFINKNYQKHIITIEDPIEFVFKNKKSIVSQRQIHLDTNSFNDGIKYALRQDPDIILVGEIRDLDTLTNALKAAETGQLVFGTLHTNGAIETVSRMVNMFDLKDRESIRIQLSTILRGTIAQRLLLSTDGNSRYLATEVLRVGETVKDLIRKNELEQIFELVEKGSSKDLVTLNMSLFELVKNNKVTSETALDASDNPNELNRLLKGVFR